MPDACVQRALHPLPRRRSCEDPLLSQPVHHGWVSNERKGQGIAVAEDHGVAVALGHILDTAGDLGEERVANVADQQRKRVRAPAQQR